MKSNIEIKENSMVSITVDANKEAWAKAQKTEFDKLAANVEVPGFRKGKAPAAKVKAMVSEFSVLQNAADEMLNELYRHGVTTNDIWPVSQPEVEIKALSPEELQVVFHVAVKPEFEVGEYKGITATKDAVIVEDAEIDAAVEQALSANVSLEVVEKAVENGDTAVIDFEGFKDDVAFEGGKAENFPLEIGSGQFIPGFEEQIVGKKANDEFDVNVTFPEDYGQESLAGAAVVFKVKLHEVKVKNMPELNDEFVATLGLDNVTTVEQYKESLSNNILAQKQAEADSKYINDLIKVVVENTTLELPEAMVKTEVENMYQQFTQRLQQQGMNEEMFLQMTNQTVEAVKEQMQPDAVDKIKYTLVLEKIAIKEDIKVSEADLNAEFEKIASMYQMDIEQIKTMIPDTGAIEFEIKMQKAADIIKDNAK